MSAHYWRNRGQAEKCEFLCVEGSYHGETLGALLVGAGVTNPPCTASAARRGALHWLLRCASTTWRSPARATSR